MKRTINLTGKRRIELDYVSASYEPTSENRQINVEWDLSTFAFNPDADVVVEVATLGNTDRFVAPLVDNVNAKTSFDVPESSSQHSTSVRLTVVEPSGQRMILGATSSISLTPGVAGRSQLALLSIQPVPNLERAFCVDFSTNKPVLQVSNQDGLYLGLIADPVFLASILPSVVETIAFQLAINSDLIESPNLTAWDRQFESWGCDLKGMEEVREEIASGGDTTSALLQAQELAETAAELFSKKFKLNKRLRAATEGEE